MYFKYKEHSIFIDRRLECYVLINTQIYEWQRALTLKEATEQIDKWLDGENKCTRS